jgi:putative ABC transport system permease protein
MLRLALRNVTRAPLRTALTVLAIAICLVAYLLLESITANWTERVAQTPDNRVVSRHRIGWDYAMPVHYAHDVAKMPGIRMAMGGSWVSVKHPSKPTLYIDLTAAFADVFARMHTELSAPEAQKRAFVANRRGLIVSDELARELGWKLGDRVHLTGTSYVRDWEFDVACIAHSTRHGFGQRAMWMHWEYYNESLPPDVKDKINIIAAEIVDPREGARLARAIDIHFDTLEDQTFTQEDQAMHRSLMGMHAALLDALGIVSAFVLGILLLIVANTIAMSVRERTVEYGVLRALGFGRGRLMALVLGEALALGLVGGAVGLLLAFPLVEHPLSRYVESSLELRALRVPRLAAAVAFALSGILGVLAALLPAHRASRLEVVAALRHTG